MECELFMLQLTADLSILKKKMLGKSGPQQLHLIIIPLEESICPNLQNSAASVDLLSFLNSNRNAHAMRTNPLSKVC